MSSLERDRTDGFGGRPTQHDDTLLDQPYGARSLGATTDAPVQLDVGGLRVQMRAEVGDSPEAVQAAADRGISGASERLPHADAIQRSFGHHDVGGVQAHVGGAATEGATAMGASAFATGNHVAFAGAPDLHTAAHEAAHVVQQRAGVQLKGGVGEAGDRYERHADAVADKVVAGESAASLLDEMAGGGGGGAGVQRAVQMERFIGNEAKHHLHIEINQDHYKFGNDVGSRIEIGKNGVYKLDQLIVVRNYLVNGGHTGNGGQACITWLESECRDHADWDEERGFKPSWEPDEPEANPHVEGLVDRVGELGLTRDDLNMAFGQARTAVIAEESTHLDGNYYGQTEDEEDVTAADLERTLGELKVDDFLVGSWAGPAKGETNPKKAIEDFKREAKLFMKEHLREEFPLKTGTYDM